MSDRVIPKPTPETQHFWDGTKAGELLLQTCNACGHTYFPPRPFCPECGSRDVKVVNGHIAEYAAGSCDVVIGRRPGVTAGQGDHFDVADPALVDCRFQGPEMRVEPPLESDHEAAAGFFHDPKASFDPCDIEVDRLFAEHRLSGAKTGAEYAEDA